MTGFYIIINFTVLTDNQMLYTQKYFTRHKSPQDKTSRTKYIALTHKVSTLNIHSVITGAAGHKPYILEPTEGLLFHYRGGCVKEFCNQKMETVDDFSATKFAPKIWKEVDGVCKDIFKDGICSN